MANSFLRILCPHCHLLGDKNIEIPRVYPPRWTSLANFRNSRVRLSLAAWRGTQGPHLNRQVIVPTHSPNVCQEGQMCPWLTGRLPLGHPPGQPWWSLCLCGYPHSSTGSTRSLLTVPLQVLKWKHYFHWLWNHGIEREVTPGKVAISSKSTRKHILKDQKQCLYVLIWFILQTM